MAAAPIKQHAFGTKLWFACLGEWRWGTVEHVNTYFHDDDKDPAVTYVYGLQVPDVGLTWRDYWQVYTDEAFAVFLLLA